MPKSPIVFYEGCCGAQVRTRIWKQGHSIACEKRGASSCRYWQPDKKRYYWSEHWGDLHADIVAEVHDFCHTCRIYKEIEK